MKIVMLGFGAVGQGVARVFSTKRDKIKAKYGLNLNLVAVTDTSGAAVCQEGLDPDLLLETKIKKGKVSEYPEHGVPGV